MEYAEDSNQNLLMILLDFEKVYVKVSWTFLTTTMDRMGFSHVWIKMVMALYKEANAMVVINGQTWPIFELQHSVRQGCPLALYVFLLVIDMLGLMLQYEAHVVEGLQLPYGTSTTNQMFANDTCLLLRGTKKI